MPDRLYSQAGQTSVSRPAFHPMTRQLCESSAATVQKGPGQDPTAAGACPSRPATPWKWHPRREAWDRSTVGSQGLCNPARVAEPGAQAPASTCTHPQRAGTVKVSGSSSMLLPDTFVWFHHSSPRWETVLASPKQSGIRVTQKKGLQGPG